MLIFFTTLFLIFFAIIILFTFALMFCHYQTDQLEDIDKLPPFQKCICILLAKVSLIHMGLVALLYRRIGISDFVRMIEQARKSVDPEDMENIMNEAMYNKIENMIEIMEDAWEWFSDWFESISLLSRIGVC
ncbi:MAG: hypothetical protein OXD44_07275, partial [Gammaproteobacteria bacterium]|nr:hypothetical protein [Gammaproteobacteria bacterium]